MKIENIIKKLSKDGYEVYRAEFDYKEFWFVNGTGLVDIIDDEVIETTAKYNDVINQIMNNSSHIYTKTGKIQELTINKKMGC